MASEDPSKGPAQGAATEAGKDTVWTPQIRRKFETKHKSEYLDPCQEAAARSIRCLHRNGGDKALCQDYFQAYRECKKQWVSSYEVLAERLGHKITENEAIYCAQRRFRANTKQQEKRLEDRRKKKQEEGGGWFS